MVEISGVKSAVGTGFTGSLQMMPRCACQMALGELAVGTLWLRSVVCNNLWD
jgi:hypothetical protein